MPKPEAYASAGLSGSIPRSLIRRSMNSRAPNLIAPSQSTKRIAFNFGIDLCQVYEGVIRHSPNVKFRNKFSDLSITTGISELKELQPDTGLDNAMPNLQAV